MTDHPNDSQRMLDEALRHLRSAIELLDAADAPGTIACHADLAAQLLTDEIAGSGPARITPPDEAHGGWQASLTS